MTEQQSHSLNWDDLKYFLAVARSGTLRGGADSIQANHTTLARRLSVMEQRVGSRLFDRSKAGLVLTQLGEDLMPYAERVEDEMTAASRVIVGRDTQPSGTIYVSMPHGLAMTSIMDDLAHFADLYPDIDLNMTFSNDVADLARREADVSLRISHEVTDDVVGRRLVQMSQAAYCTKDYAQRIRDNGGEGLQLIGWHEPEGETTARWVQESWYPKARLRHRVSELVPADHACRGRAGHGLSRLQSRRPPSRPDPRAVPEAAALSQHLAAAAQGSAQHGKGPALRRFPRRPHPLAAQRILGRRHGGAERQMRPENGQMVDIRRVERREVGAARALISSVVAETYGHLIDLDAATITGEGLLADSLVAVADGEIVGVGLSVADVVDDLWILRQARGQGVGAALLARARA